MHDLSAFLHREPCRFGTVLLEYEGCFCDLAPNGGQLPRRWRLVYAADVVGFGSVVPSPDDGCPSSGLAEQTPYFVYADLGAGCWVAVLDC